MIFRILRILTALLIFFLLLFFQPFFDGRFVGLRIVHVRIAFQRRVVGRDRFLIALLVGQRVTQVVARVGIVAMLEILRGIHHVARAVGRCATQRGILRQRLRLFRIALFELRLRLLVRTLPQVGPRKRGGG